MSASRPPHVENVFARLPDTEKDGYQAFFSLHIQPSLKKKYSEIMFKTIGSLYILPYRHKVPSTLLKSDYNLPFCKISDSLPIQLKPIIQKKTDVNPIPYSLFPIRLKSVIQKKTDVNTFFHRTQLWWADENVTNRVASCDPVFVPPHFFGPKISRLKNGGEQKRDQLSGTSATFSSPHSYGIMAAFNSEL
ncbi:hypothetical protein QUF72_21900 [Desulfobacterales bacterium HSG2]|nr:hypothetical protein [Desulfobacterales bacterium HSG2]